MDHPAGFFPERQILAMRRQALLAPVEAAQPADSSCNAVWLASVTLYPTWIIIGALGATKRPAVLLVMCYLLAGLALAGILMGGYRALQRTKVPAS